MTHKIAILKPDYHYVGTEVPFDKSVAAIMALLRQHKCERIGLMYETVENVEAATLVFQKAGLPYRIDFPLTYVEKRRGSGKNGAGGNQFSPIVKELKMQISGRIIHDRVKALLIDAEIGILDFSQAMIQFLLVPSSSGRPEPLSDYVIEHRDQLAKGKFDITYQLPEGR
jgi:hypothetical protein